MVTARRTHDRIRGVPGNWGKALECIESLYPLKSKYTDRFRLNVNTVVCAENYTEIEMLSEFMWKNYRLDGQYFNIIRGETLVGEQIKQVPPEVLPAMYAHVAKLTKRYGDRMFAADDRTRTVKCTDAIRVTGSHLCRTEPSICVGLYPSVR